MTVTEVTTRIAIVGVLGICGLFLVARAGAARRASQRVARFRITAHHAESASTQRSIFGFRVSRLAFAVVLAAIGVVSGAALGVLLSLVFLTILNVVS